MLLPRNALATLALAISTSVLASASEARAADDGRPAGHDGTNSAGPDDAVRSLEVEPAIPTTREPDLAVSEEAVRRGTEAMRSFSAGAWLRAHEQFAAADALAHSPVFVLYMARSLRHLGRWTEARARLHRVVSEDIPLSAPAPWRKAVEEARAELAELQQGLPSVRLALHGYASGGVAIRLDGRELTPAELEGETIELDPGDHEMVVSHAGHESRRTLHLDAGDQGKWVSLTLPREKSQPARVDDTKARSSAAHPPSGGRLTTPACYTAFGLGILGVVTGAVSGWHAWRETKAIRAACGDRTCPETFQGRIDSARSWANVSTVAFVAGSAGLAAGALLVVLPGVPDAAAAKDRHARGVMVKWRGRF